MSGEEFTVLNHNVAVASSKQELSTLRHVLTDASFNVFVSEDPSTRASFKNTNIKQEKLPLSA